MPVWQLHVTAVLDCGSNWALGVCAEKSVRGAHVGAFNYISLYFEGIIPIGGRSMVLAFAFF